MGSSYSVYYNLTITTDECNLEFLKLDFKKSGVFEKVIKIIPLTCNTIFRVHLNTYSNNPQITSGTILPTVYDGKLCTHMLKYTSSPKQHLHCLNRWLLGISKALSCHATAVQHYARVLGQCQRTSSHVVGNVPT